MRLLAGFRKRKSLTPSLKATKRRLIKPVEVFFVAAQHANKKLDTLQQLRFIEKVKE
jgi:hypothetical protein